MYQSRLEKRIERKLLGKRRTDDTPIGNCFLIPLILYVILSTHVLIILLTTTQLAARGTVLCI